MKILSIVGARPNFMKIAPFVHAIEKHNASVKQTGRPRIEHLLVHTGQHYDDSMSAAFFDTLDIPQPDIDLEIGSGTHAEQVGRTMIAFENVVRQHTPDWVIVVGDVNATCACSITAKKERVRVAHVEAGLRSFDLDMPEEINRMVTDRLSDLLFTTDEIASENLRREGVPDERIKLVGNIMIDTLEAHREGATKMDLYAIIAPNALDNGRAPVDVGGEDYVVMTMHRPSNVDAKETLEPIIRFLLDEVCPERTVIWPLHPRTEKRLKTFGLWDHVSIAKNMLLLGPLGYQEMLKLNMEATLMMTDSGGLQEECCVLGTPCLTLRWNTERPVTLQEHGGASVLVGNDVERIRLEYTRNKKRSRIPSRPRLWDGQTAHLIVRELTAASSLPSRGQDRTR